jgi:uncharacterized protein (DUF433 family)
MEIAGIDHICGPRIAGTRITVYDVAYYLEAGRQPAAIAELFRLSVEQIQAAIQYIEAHKAEVMAVHREIEERNARGNPPEIEEMRKQSRAKMEAWLNERRRLQNQEGNGAGYTG